MLKAENNGMEQLSFFFFFSFSLDSCTAGVTWNKDHIWNLLQCLCYAPFHCTMKGRLDLQAEPQNTLGWKSCKGRVSVVLLINAASLLLKGNR